MSHGSSRGTDISDVTSKLERCAAARWADENAVRFEASETEAILFSKGQKHKRCRREIQVGPHRVRFNPGATRWLGIWSDASLKLAENRKRRIGKTTPGRGQARAGGQPVWSPTSGGQAAIVQGTMLYASELTWNGKENVENEYQLAINRMGRASLGAFQTMPRGRANV